MQATEFTEKISLWILCSLWWPILLEMQAQWESPGYPPVMGWSAAEIGFQILDVQVDVDLAHFTCFWILPAQLDRGEPVLTFCHNPPDAGVLG